MKRALFALMIVVAVFSIAGAGSLAYFSDDEAATGNTFEVGVWDLDSDSGTFNVTGVAGSQTLTVTNTGTVPAYLYLDISITGSIGDLVNHLTAQLSVDGFVIYPMAAMNSITGSYTTGLSLDSGHSGSITLDWLPSDAYAPGDGESVTLTVNFYLQP